MLKGDVFWVDADPRRGHDPGGSRPVVILSENVFNTRSGTVIAMAFTSQLQQTGIPLTPKLASVLPQQTLHAARGAVR